MGRAQVDHFHDFLEPALAALGYAGIFAPKHQSPCLDFGYNRPHLRRDLATSSRDLPQLLRDLPQLRQGACHI